MKKRILSILLSLTLLAGIFTAPVSAGDARLPGDVNGDGEVNNADITRLMRVLAGHDGSASADACDVNGDGTVDNRDITRLMRTLAGFGNTNDKPETDGPETGIHRHSYTVTVIKEATCTEDGVRRYTCSCGDSYVSSYPASHDMIEEIIYPSTPSIHGQARMTCRICGFQYLTVLPLSTGEDPFPTDWYKDGYTLRQYHDYQEIFGNTHNDNLITPTGVISYATEHGFYFNFEGEASYEYDLEIIISKNSDLSDFYIYSSGRANASPTVLQKFRHPFNYNETLDYFTGGYYYAIRLKRRVDGHDEYSPWSKTGCIECQRTDTPREEAPEYSYEVYLLDSLGTDLLSDAVRVIYIKTENPDPTSIRIMLGDELASCGNTLFLEGNYEYNDVEYDRDFVFTYYGDLTPQIPRFRKVSGGYIFKLFVSSYSNDPYHQTEKRDDFPAGPQTIKLQEIHSSGYSAGPSFEMNVIDQRVYFNQWIRETIDTYTSSGMDPLEKMDAIEAYLNNGQFRYFTKDPDGTHLTLASDPIFPLAQTKHIDSYYSPHWITCFAEAIGGFEDIHNYYTDYPIGSGAWMAWHYMASVTYKGVTHYYSFCPSESTGYSDKNFRIDFGNTDGLTRVA